MDLIHVCHNLDRNCSYCLCSEGISLILKFSPFSVSLNFFGQTESCQDIIRLSRNFIQFLEYFSRWGNNGNRDFILGGSKITADGDYNHEIKTFAPWKKIYDQPRKRIIKQRHQFANKGPSSQSYGFPSSHGWMWELDYKESWVLKNWCCWTMVLQKTLESPLDCKEIQPVHPKGNQSWMFIGRTDAEAETPVLWLPDVKNWLIWKDPDAGKDWRQ